MDKAALRRHLRDLRKALPESVRREADRRLGDHLAQALRDTDPSRPVALYAPMGSEASPLAAPLSNPIAWPRVVTLHPPRLTFHLAPLAHLTEGALRVRRRPGEARVPASGLREEAKPTQRMRIREPDATDPEVSPLDLAAIVVPLLGFDPHGYRLGQGGGFYDALIASLPSDPALRPRLIGLAYTCQRVAELPREPHDQPVDLVLTEDGPAA